MTRALPFFKYILILQTCTRQKNGRRCRFHWVNKNLHNRMYTCVNNLNTFMFFFSSRFRETVDSIIPLIEPLSKDTEPVVKQHLVEQLRHLAKVEQSLTPTEISTATN